MSRRAFFQAILAIATVAVVFLSAGRLFAQGRSDEAFERVRAVQERHTERLLAKPGVVGTAIGLDENGRHVVLVLLEKEGVPDIPADLDGVPVRRKVTGTIYALPKPPAPGPKIPNQPTNLVAVANGTRIDLTWKDNSKNELGFRLERSDGGSGFAPIATTRKNAISYRDTVPSRSIGYTYRVCAFNDAGDSFYSNDASVPAEGPPDTDPPLAPTNLSAAAAGSSQIDLTWTASTSDDVASYSVYRSQTSGGSYGQVKSGITGTQYSDTGLTASRTYYYVVRAVDTAGNESGNSNEASATTDAAPEPTDPRSRFARPVPIGVSTGHPTITAGTISCRVTNGSTLYVLSNNHVYAAGNAAQTGDAVIQPGRVDGGTSHADDIGTLFAFQEIFWSTWPFITFNTIDAAIAEVIVDTVDGQPVPRVGTSTPSGGYGKPNTQTVAAYLGQSVKKYGRTTGLTTGTVEAVNAIIAVQYNPGQIAYFIEQIGITPGSFSGGGDSGSLIVTNDDNCNPVGLLFAGSSTETYANPIGLVLGHFEVSIDGK